MVEPISAVSAVGAAVKLVFSGVQGASKLSKHSPPYMMVIEGHRTSVTKYILITRRECAMVMVAAAKSRGDLNVTSWVFGTGIPPPPPPDFNDCLQSYLGCQPTEFVGILAAIRHRVDSLNKELGRYGKVKGDGETEDKNILHRTMHWAHSTINKSDYVTDMVLLRELVSNLTALRTRAERRVSLKAPEGQQVPPEYRTRGKDAAGWLCAISEKWSCNPAVHRGHCVMLLLATEPRQGQACFDVIIQRTPGHPNDQPLCVQARSKPCEKGHAAPALPLDHDENKAEGAEEPATAQIETDLAGDEDMCSRFSVANGSPLTSLGTFQHKMRSFDIFPGHSLEGQPRPYVSCDRKPLCSVFSQHVDECVCDEERLWLAILVLKSALRYHTTPWWPQNWVPTDLWFYGSSSTTDELFDLLQTLHLTVELPRGAADFPIDEDVRSTMDAHSIQNLTIWCVGVMLLEIGLWQSVQWEFPDQVQSLLSSLVNEPQLGPRYLAVVDRMINWHVGREMTPFSQADMVEEIYHGLRQVEKALNEWREEMLGMDGIEEMDLGEEQRT